MTDPFRPIGGSLLVSDLVVIWRAGVIRLDPTKAPCPGLRDWSTIRSRLAAFVNGEEAETAAALGWTTLDLFSVHRVVGTMRADCTGALLFGHPIDEVWADRITMGNLTFYRKAKPHQEAVAIWDYREPPRQGIMH